MQRVQELFDPILARNRRVVDECQRGYASQPQVTADLPAEERDHPFERAGRVAPGRLVAESGVKHTSRLQISAHLDAGQGHESNAGIVNLPAEQLCDLGSQLIGDTFWAGALGHRAARKTSACRLTRSSGPAPSRRPRS